MFKKEPEAVKQALRESLQIGLFFALVCITVYASGLDAWLAKAVYNPEAAWAWKVRSIGALPGGILAAAALVLCLMPWAPKRWPLVYRSALVLMLTTVLGAGLLNQVVLQDAFNRLRPRETVLAATPAPNQNELQGNSMPSGHAAMGFLLTAPYFVLRRKGKDDKEKHSNTRNALAYGFLIGGLFIGGFIGYARMVVGAHFASDVIAAAGVSLFSSRLLKEIHRLSPLLLAGGTAVALAALVLGNHFSVNLSYSVNEPFRRVTLPCTIQTTINESLTTPLLQAHVEGYGAPISQLKLGIQHGALTLITSYGLYHSLRCTAYLSLPSSSAD